VVFSNGTMVSMSGKSESVNERTLYKDQQRIKFHILAVRRKFRWIY